MNLNKVSSFENSKNKRMGLLIALVVSLVTSNSFASDPKDKTLVIERLAAVLRLCSNQNFDPVKELRQQWVCYREYARLVGDDAVTFAIDGLEYDFEQTGLRPTQTVASENAIADAISQISALIAFRIDDLQQQQVATNSSDENDGIVDAGIPEQPSTSGQIAGFTLRNDNSHHVAVYQAMKDRLFQQQPSPENDAIGRINCHPHNRIGNSPYAAQQDSTNPNRPVNDCSR